jgi:hypothetical protein
MCSKISSALPHKTRRVSIAAGRVREIGKKNPITLSAIESATFLHIS